MSASIRAGIAYAVSVFAFGFVLGTARVLFVVPRLGETLAVAAETPVILTASWFLSTTLMQRLGVGADTRTRVLAGAVAFVVLLLLESALAVSLLHRSMTEYLAQLRSPAGALGLAGQLCFATFPLLDALVRRRPMR